MDGVITIQKTSKKLKAQKAIGILLLIMSSIWILAAPEAEKGLPAFGLFVSFVFYAQARVRTWWGHH